jgi:2-keto-4-pentenoate hydratase/2-oxohepta-3-ene-1,7-dioic acid hydratase in catechol pathway
MAIIRFVDEKGETQWGFERDDNSVCLTRGELFDGLEETDTIVRPARLLAPIVPTNIFGIGLNYRKHAAETGAELPRHPVVFMKPTSTVNNPGDPIVIPAAQLKGPEVDYEAELAVVIGKSAKDVSPEKALDHVLGYTCANDVSARRWQKNAGGGQWIRGKSFDTFCPLGPRLIPAKDMADPQNLTVRSILNGKIMQESNTSDMIYTVAQIIAFLSRDTTLLPGTVILSGTPEGVGFVRNPPVFLAPGDTITCEIGGIGELTNPVVDAADN